MNLLFIFVLITKPQNNKFRLKFTRKQYMEFVLVVNTNPRTGHFQEGYALQGHFVNLKVINFKKKVEFEEIKLIIYLLQIV